MAGNSAERARTGIQGLDDIVGGGLPPGRLYLLQGNPGSGKTTLALQFLIEGARRGETVLYVTLSETREELADVATSHGWTLEGISLYELAPRVDDLGLETQQTIFQPAEVELSEAMGTILARVEDVKPTRVVLDSLSEIRLLAQSSLRYRRQVLALKHYFAGSGCTVFMVDDLTSEPGDQQLQSLAHGVICLEQIPQVYGTDRRRVRVSKLRGVSFRTGYHDVVLERGGLVIHPRMIAKEHDAPFERTPLSSGLAAMDALVGGGLEPGSSVLMLGPAGAGKSSLCSQFASAAAARGERAAIFTFEESCETLLARADGLGSPLRAQVAAGSVTAHQINPVELSPGEFVQKVRKAVEQHEARVVVIDSVNGYLASMPQDVFLLSQLHELFSYLANRGVVTLLTMAQSGLMGPSMHSPIDVSYLADTVVLLRYFEAGGRIRKAISVVKRRSGKHEDMIREFSMSSGGIHIGEPLAAFEGVLTGVPKYLGAQAPLIGASGDETSL